MRKALGFTRFIISRTMTPAIVRQHRGLAERDPLDLPRSQTKGEARVAGTMMQDKQWCADSAGCWLFCRFDLVDSKGVLEKGQGHFRAARAIDTKFGISRVLLTPESLKTLNEGYILCPRDLDVGARVEALVPGRWGIVLARAPGGLACWGKVIVLCSLRRRFGAFGQLL